MTEWSVFIFRYVKRNLVPFKAGALKVGKKRSGRPKSPDAYPVSPFHLRKRKCRVGIELVF